MKTSKTLALKQALRLIHYLIRELSTQGASQGPPLVLALKQALAHPQGAR